MRSLCRPAAFYALVAAFALGCSDVDVKDPPTPGGDVTADIEADVGGGGDASTGSDASGGDGGAVSQDATVGQDVTSKVPQPPTLCHPCKANTECVAVTGKKSTCNDHGALGFYCGAGCASDDDCRSDFRCADLDDVAGNPTKQCVPKGKDAASIGECFCSDKAAADKLETTCSNELVVGGEVVGACTGKRACGDSGLSACDAEVPAQEVCDGKDNDCSGKADDNVCDDGQACTVDSCDKDGKCVNKASSGGCDDGDPCTVADNCSTGACKGSPNTCDDANSCTNDSCVPGEGCKNEKISGCNKCSADKDCDDGKACTIDKCASATQSCASKPKVCDDGDACTTDACDPGTGDCKATPMATCTGVQTLPFSANFACGSKANDLWTVIKSTNGPAWAFDGNPAPPGAKSPACSLNFNNGTDYQCPSGAASVQGSVVSPWIDATAAHPKANIRVTMQVGGTWENNNNDELLLQYTLDGQQYNTIYDFPSPSKPEQWQTRTLSIGAVKGKKFRLRLHFFTKDCNNNTGTGPFIDDLKVEDTACYSNADCGSSNACVVSACINNYCQNTNKCNDGSSCTADSCTNGACKFTPVNDGKDCTDNTVCGADKKCAGGKCAATKPAKEGAACDDGKQCTIDDTCAAGTCKGTPKCDDGNLCTADSCFFATGNCFHEPITSKCNDGDACTSDDACKDGTCTGKQKDCDDNDACTVDSCKKTDATCVHEGGQCDDGDSCTVDTCNTKTGGCSHGADSKCGATVGLPYEQPFECGAKSVSAWTLTGTKGGPEWKVDDNPAPPSAFSGTCSLNFNNGKDYACPSGATKVEGEATSPWIDATGMKTSLLRLSFRVSGNWEPNNNDQLRLEARLEGGGWSNIYNTNNTNVNYWYLRTLTINQYKGKKFQVRFRFFTNNCSNNSGVGPYIDDLKVWDAGCLSAKDCDNGNACTTWSCDTNNGNCSGQNKSCKDDNPCTYDQCDAGTGKCVFPHVNDGGGCNDDNACTDPDRCQAGQCYGKPLACDDGSACTKDSCDNAKGCVFSPVCNDGDPCTEDICNEADQKCSTKAAPAGAGCDDGDLCTTFGTCSSGKCATKPGSVGVLTASTYSNPTGVATDGKGNAFLAARGAHRIYKVSGGTSSTLAGTSAGFADGDANKAKFNSPQGIRWHAGAIYVADQGNGRIRVVANGKVSTLAGLGNGFADGPKSKARFNSPHDLAVAADGSVFVCDSGNARIRRVAKDGTTSTHSGIGGGYADGPKNVARFNNPRGIALASGNVLYVADTYNHRIRRVDGNGAVTTLAGTTQWGNVDGLGAGARFYRPHGVAMGEPGWLYVADSYNNLIRRVSTKGQVVTVAGSTGGYQNGPLGVARFNRPWHLLLDGDKLIVSDHYNSRVRTISATSKLCDDNNVCTTDGCDKATGKCDNQLASKCDDNDPCTLDGCNPANGKCNHAPNTCDDGDSCTAGTCNKADGSCTYTDVSSCNNIEKIGYKQAFNCGSKSAAQWELKSEGGPIWAVDDSPANPKPVSEKCSLNFNNGKDYACATGAKKVSGTATSPWLDATKVSSVGGLQIRFRYSGRWETNNNDEFFFEHTTDDKTWTKRADLSWTSNSWGTYNTSINELAGKKFRLRFSFETKDCNANGWVGPFIDDIEITDMNCGAAADCNDGTLCTQDQCNNGRCSWPGVNCNDYDPCTSDSCKPETGCQNLPLADGNGCSDNDSCTSNDVCKQGKCIGVATGKDGAACSDGKSCTFGDTCTSGKCVGVMGCDDGNSCTLETCDVNGNCKWEDDPKACDDGNPCTDDDCRQQPGSKCHHVPKCNDHNSCTTDTCDAKTGACSHQKIAGCQPTLPWETNFDCDGGAAGWTLESVHKGGPQWAVDKDTTNKPSEHGACTLNFNDGTGYACPAGAQKVEATAESPWIDGSAFSPQYTQLYAEWSINGQWYPTNARASVYFEVSKDGKAWVNRRTMNYNLNNWSLQQASLGGYAGGKFKVRFRIVSQGCGAPTGDGPFVDRLRIYDRRCFSDADCTDTNACTVRTCINNSCSAASLKCEDDNACLAVGCHHLWGCRHTPRHDGYLCGDGVGCTREICKALQCVKDTLNEGAGCNDGNTCTTGDKCTGGNCTGTPTLKDGDPCSDSNACTTADTCSGGKCAGLKGRVEPTGGDAWSQPYGVAVLTDGSIVASNTGYHRLRLYKGGAWSDFAGSSYGYGDGKGTAAKFRNPSGVASGPNTSVYVADRTNHMVRKVAADGTVSTLAGNEKAGKSDGKGNTATFNQPWGVAASGNDVIVADTYNHLVRKVAADGTTTTIAGGAAGFADGKGAAAKFNRPFGVAVDKAGVIYVADSYNHRIRKIAGDGTVTSWVGSSAGFQDGIGTQARVYYPYGISFDADGLLLVADRQNHRIRRIDALGRIISLTGSRGYGQAGGALSQAQWTYPSAVAADASGGIWVANTSSNNVLRIVWDIGNVCDDAKLCTNNGCDTKTGACDNGPTNCDDGAPCTVNSCSGNTGKCASTGYGCDDGNPCSADSCDNKAGCKHTLVAGCTTCGSDADCGDGKPCTKDVCDDKKGCQNTAIAGCSACKAAADCGDGDACTQDLCAGGACKHNKLADGAGCDDGSICTALDACAAGSCKGTSAQVSTFSGTGDAGYANGNPDSVKFSAPSDVAVSPEGFVFIADAGNKRIRWAYNSGQTNNLTNLNAVLGVGFGDGYLYVPDRGAHRIHRVRWGFDSIKTYAGSGAAGLKDGAAATAQFKGPSDVAAGSLKGTHTAWVADTGNNLLRRVVDGLVSVEKIQTANHKLQAPTYLDFDGNALFVVESGTKRVLRVSVGTDNSVVTLTNGQPANPAGIAASPQGLWIADTLGHSVWLLGVPTGTTGAATTTQIFGGKSGFKDGPAHIAQIAGASGVASGNGRLLIADTNNHRVRALAWTKHLCSDGASCTGDFCDAKTGSCAWGSAKSDACDDGDPKTTDFCHSSLGKCVHK